MAARANSLTERVTAARRPDVPATMAGPVVAVLLDCLERLGYDAGALVAGTPAAGVDLHNPDARVPYDAYGSIVCRAQQSRSTPNIALEIACVTPIGAYPLIDYLVITSETVAEGVRQLARYLRLAGSPVALTLDEEAVPIRVEMASSDPFSVEHLAALMVQHFRRETDGRFDASSVSFRHVPDDAAAFERRLGCSVRPSAQWSGVSISPEMWRIPLRRRDAVLRQVLESHANAIAAALPSRSGFADEVQRVLTSRINGGDTSIGGVARQLGVSARTLQRRLMFEGISFQALVDDARKAAAQRYLSDSHLALGEVAYLVGYSEPAPFHRAFKRWFGMTPDAYRRQAQPR
jgi:AraC-like DNA-binding protein